MAFTARTETYLQQSGLGTPFDITVTKPTGTVDGDILFCLISWYPSPTTLRTIDAVPSGWTLLGEYLDNSDRYALYYKIAASEPDSWVWSFTGSTKVRATCSCYTSGNFDPTDPIDAVSNTAYRTNDANCIAASMNVTAINSPLIFWAAVFSSNVERTFTKPSVPTSDWLEDDDYWSTTADFAIEICSMLWSGSGATGAMSATISASMTAKHAFAVALATPGTIYNAAATMSGTGILAGIARRICSGIGIMSGAGNLAAAGRRICSAKAILSGTGSLAAIAKGIKPGKAILLGMGSLTARGMCILIAKAQLTGAGFLIAIGRLVGINEEVSITMPDKIITPSFPDKDITVSFDERTIKVR
jgi:hypothetical protein